MQSLAIEGDVLIDFVLKIIYLEKRWILEGCRKEWKLPMRDEWRLLNGATGALTKSRLTTSTVSLSPINEATSLILGHQKSGQARSPRRKARDL